MGDLLGPDPILLPADSDVEAELLANENPGVVAAAHPRFGRSFFLGNSIVYLMGLILTASGAISTSGTVVETTSPSTVDLHTSWVGGKNSAFHDPGPTAQANTASSSPCSRRYRPGACASCVPTGRSATRCTGPGMIAPSRTTGPFVSYPSPASAVSSASRPSTLMTASSPMRILAG